MFRKISDLNFDLEENDELFWLGREFNILFKEQFQYLLELRIKLSEEIQGLVEEVEGLAGT